MPDRHLLSGSPVPMDASNRPLSRPAGRALSAPRRTEEPDRRQDLPSVGPSRGSPGDGERPAEELPAEPGIPDLLSGTDVEQIFARSARTLHRWEQRGHLTPVRVGHAKFYRAADIRRLVAGQLAAAMETQAGAQSATGQAARTGKTGDKKMP